MKILATIFLGTFLLVKCEGQPNPGQHLGNFKHNCEVQKGIVEQTGPNNYKCTLPDGTVLVSQ